MIIYKSLQVVEKERFELSEELPPRTLSRGVVSAAHPLFLLKNEIIVSIL